MDIRKVLSDLSLSISQKVIIAILFNNGDNDPDAASVAPTKPMSDFGFDGMAYSDLTDLFNVIAKAIDPAAPGISFADVKSAETVQDCINLV